MREGRWTIHKRGWGHLVSATDPTDVEPGSWPVVPCDDAAIERVMDALDDGRVFPGDESSITRDELRALAVEALEAAANVHG